MLIDGIIGPLLEAFGVIEIDETGEWKRVQRVVGPREYQKKERPERPSLFERIKAWFNKLWLEVKERLGWGKSKRVGVNELRRSVNEATKTILRENKPRSKVKAQEHLRKITKMEGKLLAGNENYRLWVGDHFPYDDEIEEGVVYVIRGQGEPVAPNSRYLSGIKQDAYYVWDKTNERFEEIGTIPISTAPMSHELKELEDANKKLQNDIKGLKNTLKEIKDTNDGMSDFMKGYVTFDPNMGTIHINPGFKDYKWWITDDDYDEKRNSRYTPPFY